jgi:hypothetical protein
VNGSASPALPVSRTLSRRYLIAPRARLCKPPWHRLLESPLP